MALLVKSLTLSGFESRTPSTNIQFMNCAMSCFPALTSLEVIISFASVTGLVTRSGFKDTLLTLQKALTLMPPTIQTLKAVFEFGWPLNLESLSPAVVDTFTTVFGLHHPVESLKLMSRVDSPFAWISDTYSAEILAKLPTEAKFSLSISIFLPDSRLTSVVFIPHDGYDTTENIVDAFQSVGPTLKHLRLGLTTSHRAKPDAILKFCTGLRTLVFLPLYPSGPSLPKDPPALALQQEEELQTFLLLLPSLPTIIEKVVYALSAGEPDETMQSCPS
ncbi:hypothetical protein BT69DRAFT_1358999 [Atractiella rhizophila]|nr:hypothetical protein BT69DRAFT_1358999 [Atractiella rhizophila]